MINIYSESYQTVTEICEITGLSIATVHRILQELVECGFVEKDYRQKRYRAGFESWSFAMRLKQTDYLHEAAKEEMARLNDLSLETIHLIALALFALTIIASVGGKSLIKGLLMGMAGLLLVCVGIDMDSVARFTFGENHLDSEAANNAVTGATLIPLLTLGIPGDTNTAVLLGALTMQGIAPGPTLFTTQRSRVYAIMVGSIFVNIFMYLPGVHL